MNANPSKGNVNDKTAWELAVEYSSWGAISVFALKELQRREEDMISPLTVYPVKWSPTNADGASRLFFYPNTEKKDELWYFFWKVGTSKILIYNRAFSKDSPQPTLALSGMSKELCRRLSRIFVKIAQCTTL